MREAVLSILLAASAVAQPPAFEAASIKPTKDFSARLWDSHTGTISLRGHSLKSLICVAYHVKESQVSGGPKWLDEDRFDIYAKSEGPAEDPQLLAMLQTLLAERFQLVFHHEEKIASAFALVAAKSGLKIKPVEAEGSRSNSSKGRIVAKGVSMEKLAEILSRQAGAPVSDMTGAAGVYDFTLEWSTEGDEADRQSALFASLQQQLGLKLETRKLPVDLFVIDRAEKPTEN